MTVTACYFLSSVHIYMYIVYTYRLSLIVYFCLVNFLLDSFTHYIKYDAHVCY